MTKDDIAELIYKIVENTKVVSNTAYDIQKELEENLIWNNFEKIINKVNKLAKADDDTIMDILQQAIVDISTEVV